MHPDVLLEQLTARQLFEWWLVYHEEPFGDLRRDLRAWAQACVTWGAEEVKLTWPYLDSGPSVEEIQSEMQRIEKAIAHGDSS